MSDGHSTKKQKPIPPLHQTHGQSAKGKRTRAYNTWHGMLQRCRNKNSYMYRHYGGRGISVCQRWLTFSNFFADMGQPPTTQHTLDRINNDGNYEPSNCRWATRKEQSNNTRYNVRLEFMGKIRTITEWANELGIKQNTINYRLRRGWTVERALTACLHNNVRVTFMEQDRTVTEWANDLGTKASTIICRLRRGWTVERALTEPVHTKKKAI